MSHSKPLPCLLLVCDVPVRPDQTGGSVVLWRHGQRLQQLRWLEPRQALSRPAAWLQTLQRQAPRWHLQRLLLILQPLLLRLGTRLDPGAVAAIRQHHQAILTVAHGTRWLEAMALARASGRPLITLFFDWYPDASGCMAGWRQLWDRAFRELHRRSDLVFYVSEGMRQELGPHPNGLVLPPIPADLDPAAAPAAAAEAAAPAAAEAAAGMVGACGFSLYYSGLAGGLYSQPLRALLQSLVRDGRFRLHVSGSESHTLAPLPAGAPVRLSGFLDGEAWNQAFAEADALLVVLPFHRSQRRHLRTHFPSKLIEYANRRKPIVIWGPASSSAALWAEDACHTLAITDPDPVALLEAIASWLPNLEPGELRPRFDPDQIHHRFETALARLVQP